MASGTNANGGSKGQLSMKVQMRRSLLSRVSTLAIIAAAAGGLGSVQQAEAAGCSTSQTIGGTGNFFVSSPVECVTTNSVTGNVTVDANVGDPGPDFAPFFVGKTITGTLLNNATISGGYTDPLNSTFGALTIFGDVQGGVQNEGAILSGAGNALQLGYTSGGEGFGSSMTGNITNNSAITGFQNGIAALYGTMSGELINNSNGVITGGDAGVYIADSFTNWSGGIYNAGSIHGGAAGIQIGDLGGGSTNVAFSGGIYNDYGGTISSVSGPAIFASGASYNDGLTNHGLITETGNSFPGSFGGVGVVFDATTVSGDIYNDGEIDGLRHEGLLITSNVNEFDGNFTNTNVIDGAEGGVIIETTTVHGNFNNSGSIGGGAGPSATGVGYFVTTLAGPGGEGATITNTGTITGSNGFVIFANTVNADFTNGDVITNAGFISGSNSGVVIDAMNWTGDITNNGTIEGGVAGLSLGYNPFLDELDGGTLNGSIVNNLSISGGDTGLFVALNNLTGDITNSSTGSIHGGNTGAFISVGDYEGNFTNNGTITGKNFGVLLDPSGPSGPSGTFNGNATNTGFMSGSTAWKISFDSFTGDISNTGGTVQGEAYGLYVDVNDMQGNFSNTGSVTAGGEGGVGVRIGSATTDSISGSEQSFTGNINNSGLIHGGRDGLDILVGTYDGSGGEGFTNSGSIVGDFQKGVEIFANSWTGNITNAAGGFIQGGQTGFLINVGSINGNFTNDGTIVGLGTDTGLHIITSSYTGDIGNGPAGVISAPSNALHLEIDTFSGQISNDGSIISPSGDAVVIAGHTGPGTYNGAFTNRGIINGSDVGILLTNASLNGGITNDGGTVTGGNIAISTFNATAATTITNTGGGIINGNVNFSQNFGDTFIGEDGGIVGDINGTGGEGGSGPNDDKVIVQNGTQYFLGKASNLSSFTVDGGGAAIMGALFEGDPNGTGYSFNNVDAINVNNGGTLYIDKATTLTAGTYTQQAGGTLEFYLAAPGGAGFSSLTGDQLANPATDYGQVHLTGTATLDGNIAAFLDPAYASANAGLSSVTYDNVLVADGGISGNFNTLALISNTSLFELNEVLHPNSVDLTVTRSPIGQLAGIAGIVVDTGGPWKSLVNDRSNGIGSGSCGIAGPGWCLNAFAANDAGGTGVMSDATPGADAFEWLRTGVRRVGETAVWARAVGVWGNTDGDNIGHPGTNFDTYGAIAGIDRAFSQLFMAGAAAQWTKTNIDFDGLADNADVDSFEVGGYMSYGDARFYLNANASVIFHDINVTRFAPGGAAFGNYNGTTLSGYAEAGRIFETYEGLRIQPLAALSYGHLDTDSYNETGTATTLLHVFDANLDSLKSLLGARFAYPFALDSGRKVVPEFRAVWAHEFLDDQASFLANPILNPLNVATVTGEIFNRDSLIVGAGVTAPLSDATTLFLDYDANLNDNFTTHTVSGGFRTRW